MGKISQEEFTVWKCMELAGILRGKKRRRFITELERKFNTSEINSNDERIILAAERNSRGDKQIRRKYLNARLKHWGKIVNRQTA